MHSSLLKRYAFSFLAFAVPLLLRTVPKFLMGPYAVGFDTMGLPSSFEEVYPSGEIAIYLYETAP